MDADSPKNTSGDTLIISYLALRKSVGILGIALPFVSIAGTYLSGCRAIAPSISQYYYSAMGNFFVGALCGVAIFLFSYRGYDAWDRILTNAAAVFALGAAFFPTHLTTTPPFSFCTGNSTDCSNLSDVIHVVTAALFFASLSAISIFLFTRSKGIMTPEKKLRNRIYRICGFIMLGSVILIGVYKIPAVHVAFEKYKPTFYLETLALLAFGFSWLTKGEFLLKDD